MKEKWTKKERQYIMDNAGTKRDEDMAANLTRISGRQVSLQAVRKQRRLLGIYKKSGRGCCEVIAFPTKSTQLKNKTKTNVVDQTIKIEGAAPNLAPSLDEAPF